MRSMVEGRSASTVLRMVSVPVPGRITFIPKESPFGDRNCD